MNRWWLLMLAGCGRIGFAPTTSDAGNDVVSDAPLGEFAGPVLVAELSDPAADDDPSLTDDELELFFSSYRSGGVGDADLWVSTRGQRTEPWGAPQPVAGLNTIGLDENPGVSPDGLQIWFTSDRGGNVDLWTAQRANRGAAWGSPQLVAELSSGVEELGVAVDRSLLRIVFNRGSPPDLHEAVRPSTSQQWAAMPIASLNTAADESSPFLSGATEIYFSSDRAGGTSGDLYRATRAVLGAPFGSIEPLSTLNTSGNDDDPWVSLDGRRIYFMSDRSGNEEIWMATR